MASQPFSLPFSPTSLRPNDPNNLKVDVCVNRIGQWVFYNVFTWGYQGGTLYPYEYMGQLENSSQLKRSLFPAQRTKLEAKCPVGEFDITLLYTLMHSCCGLADSTEHICQKKDCDVLECVLLKIKKERNLYAHETQTLTDKEMKDIIQALGHLYSKALQSAGSRFGVDPDIVKIVSTAVEESLYSTRNATISMSYNSVKSLLDHLKDLMLKEGQPELRNSFKPQSKFPPGILTLYSESHELENIFAEVDLEFSSDKIKVNVKDILEDWITVRKPKDVLMVVGPAGSGKTTLMKYLIHNWTSKKSDIKRILDYDLVFHVECRNSTILSFDQLVHMLMPTTAANIREAEHLRSVLSVLKVLIVVDGVDELQGATVDLLSSIFSLDGDNVHIICSTRSVRTDLMSRITEANGRGIVTMDLLGINDPYKRQDFIFKVLSVFGDETFQNAGWNALYSFLVTKGHLARSHFFSPLKLTLLILLWIENKEVNHLSSATQMYEQIEDFLFARLIERLSTHEMTKRVRISELQSKVQKFIGVLNQVAFDSLVNCKLTLHSTALKPLKDICTANGLPYNEVITTFLNPRQSLQGFHMVDIYSFFHASDQEFRSAQYMRHRLKENPEESILDFLLHTRTDFKLRSHQFLVYLTGCLAQEPPGIFAKYVKDIVDYAKPSIDSQLGWMELMSEGQCDRKLCEVVGQTMVEQGIHRWVITEKTIRIIDLLLQFSVPSDIKISFFSDPYTVPKFEEVLNLIVKLPINLDMSYQYHYLNAEHDSDKLVKLAVSSPETKCNLTDIIGCLSLDVMPLLPPSMTFVCLRVTYKELLAVHAHLPSLPKLKILELSIIDLDLHKPSTYPCLNTDASVYVALSRLYDSE
ncbi:uncharacterized protein LOC143030031 [Oratosquilla oratoria]|uniref:uncharacterized protein LOC143030031 n=1 Tax=Oratosquilla oratoria TaxID=337810 RepID=UPI003F76DF5D